MLKKSLRFQGTVVTSSSTVSDVSCWGDNDGSINLSVSGGTPATTGLLYLSMG